ncbi:MAG: MBL fold metallo-hydrolase [Actinobacteria bacterium]|nr:MBL fold metallo-hydrolase [Actinomycetota bacterium]
MKVTVLGSSASYAGAGQACSGYLVEHDGTKVLMDCGNGVIANLCEIADPVTLDAVVITHGHPDHFLDIYALQALLRYAPQGPASPLPLWLPESLFEQMGCLLSERGRIELAEAFIVHELIAEQVVRIGSLAITPLLVDHAETTFALSVESPDGARVCYTSDTKAGDAVLRAARDADLLIAEATMPEEYIGRAPHMTAREAAEIARAAGAGRLVLTHIWPTNDREHMLRDAIEIFGPNSSIAKEFDIYELDSTALRTT